MEKHAALVLISVANELAEMAKNSMPILRKGEVTQREWYKDATYYRETNFNGQKFIAMFDFRQRKSRRVLAENDNVNS